MKCGIKQRFSPSLNHFIHWGAELSVKKHKPQEQQDQNLMQLQYYRITSLAQSYVLKSNNSSTIKTVVLPPQNTNLSNETVNKCLITTFQVCWNHILDHVYTNTFSERHFNDFLTGNKSEFVLANNSFLPWKQRHIS